MDNENYNTALKLLSDIVYWSDRLMNDDDKSIYKAELEHKILEAKRFLKSIQ